MNATDIITALEPFIEVLETLQVPYQIGGSVASSAQGLPRATLDVDLVADVRPSHVAPLVERLEDRYYIDGDMIRQAVSRRTSFNIIHLDTALKIDVFAIKPRAYDLAAFQRRYQGTLGDSAESTRFYLVSPEDVILNKLEWYHKGGGVSDRQWQDILGVMRVQGSRLDRAYLQLWAENLGVAELLARVTAEADSGTQK